MRKVGWPILCLALTCARLQAVESLNCTLLAATLAPPSSVAMSGSRALISDGLLLALLDLSDPSHPLITAQTVSPDPVNTILLDDGLALVTDPGGFRLYDWENPDHLAELSRFETPDTLGAGLIWDGLAYLCAGGQGVHIYDLRESSQPVELGSWDTPGIASDLALRDSLLFVADQEGGLRVLDVSQPALPVEIGSLVLEDPFHALDRMGEFVYVATSLGLRVLDLSQPELPRSLLLIPYSSPYLGDVCRVGSQLLASYSGLDTGSGLLGWSLANPGQPVPDGSLLFPGYVQCLAAGGQLLCAPLYQHYTSVVDVSGTQLHEVGRVADAGNYNQAEARGGEVHLCNGTRGLEIRSLAEEDSLALLGGVPWLGCLDLAFCGDLVAVTTSDSLYTLDLGGPGTPQVLGGQRVNYEDYTVKRSSSVVDSLLYIAGIPGLRVVDLHDPTRPWVRDVLSLGTPVSDVAVEGRLVAVAQLFNGLQLVDASQPDSLRLLGSLDLPGWSQALAFQDSLAYMAMRNGLRIVDARDPAAPQEVAFWERLGDYMDIKYEDGLVYLAGASGLDVLDVSDPGLPRLVGFWRDHKLSYGLAVSDAKVCLPHGQGGLRLLQFDGEDPVSPPPASRPSRLQPPLCHPNPFNPSATITFQLPQAQAIRLDLFDSLGRRVCTLVDGWRPAGLQEIRLEGRGLASGLYFCRLETTEGAVSGKLLLLR